MHIHRRQLTQHRFQRLVLWTLAVLTWIAAILPNASAASARHQRQRFDLSLPWLTHRVSQLLIVRAAQLSPRRHKRISYWRRGRDLRRRHLTRTLLGARLRRKFRNKDFATWIANLIAVLRNLDTHARALNHRLRRGLTRVWRFWTAIAPVEHAYGPPASPPACADSS